MVDLLVETVGPGPCACACVWSLREGVVSGTKTGLVVGVVVVTESGCGGCCDDDGSLVSVLLLARALALILVHAPVSIPTPTPAVV